MHLVWDGRKGLIIRTLLVLRLALLAVKIVCRSTDEFTFESWVDLAHEFLRIERKIITIVQTFIVFFLIASGFELLES